MLALLRAILRQGVDIGAHRPQFTVEKSRSRAVNTRMGAPIPTRIVGPLLPSCPAAAAAADCPAPPSTTEVPPAAMGDSPPTTHRNIRTASRRAPVCQKWVHR